jgi:hypothetical protein
VLAGAGTGATAAGLALGIVSNRQGLALLPALSRDAASWDGNIDAYSDLRTREGVGAAMAAAGSAAIVGVVVSLVVERTARRRRLGREVRR